MRFGLPNWSPACLACLALFTSSGCLCLLNPVPKPPTELVESCQEIPCGGRRHVYVFLINGLDPAECCNLVGLRSYLHQLGFTKTYYGQVFHTPWLADEIRKIHHEDPNARVALVGFGLGAHMAQHLTQQMNCEDIDIDLQIYLGGTALAQGVNKIHNNQGRILNVQMKSCLGRSRPLDDADNLCLNDVWRCLSPTNPHVVEVITRELVELACSIPLPAPPGRPAPEKGPVPDQTDSGAEEQSQPETVNVLQPVQRLRMPRPKQQPEAVDLDLP